MAGGAPSSAFYFSKNAGNLAVTRVSFFIRQLSAKSPVKKWEFLQRTVEKFYQLLPLPQEKRQMPKYFLEKGRLCSVATLHSQISVTPISNRAPYKFEIGVISNEL